MEIKSDHFIDQNKLRKDFVDALIKRPISFNMLSRELKISAQTMRKLMRGKDIHPEKAFLLTKYINSVMEQK